MKNYVLYTYKNSSSLKKFLSVNSDVQCKLFSEMRDDLDVEIEYYVDITSIGDAVRNLQNSVGLLFNIEDIFIKFINKYKLKFICRYEVKEFLLENFPLIFVSDLNLIDDDEYLLNTEINEKVNEIFKISNFSDEEFNEILKSFNDKLIGHDHFKLLFNQYLNEFRVFNKIGEHKILSIFLFGESGIGKTEVARIFHELVAKDERMIKISFGNYGSQGAINSLIGSPRGYIGSEDGELNRKIDNSRTSIILIDEFEKADKSIINFFLEVLEEGKYTDMLGVEHDLNGYIIIFTSNLNVNNIQNYITPEFYNRLNLKVKFNLLTIEDKKMYLNRRISELSNKIKENSGKSIPDEIMLELNSIDVSKYDNIREIELEIKKKFVDIFNQI